MNWPALPSDGFVAGRTATVSDVDRGNAIFCQQSDGDEAGEPSDVVVPQYAIWHGDDGDVPAILIQAERHITDPDGEAVFGLRTLNGGDLVANSGEVTLLGRQTPSD